ncbi:MAG TPA: hypothetical protein VMG30_19475 [Acidobacteriota bacterium]|nr:hypothetical protein [Acidobacteriota bacterium]
MSQVSGFPLPTDYKDRRAGLIAFGILEILLGLLCVLILVGMSVVMLLAPQFSKELTSQLLGIVLAFYGLLALAMIWLGIGSILCRRWARVLILIGAWSVLMLGIVVLIFYGIFGWKLYSGIITDANAAIILIFGMAIQAIFLIVLPGLLVFFYGSRNVIATCVARDPHTRWTDRCPMPVLATSLWLALGSLSILFLPLCYRSVVAWFGVLLTGTPATILLVIFMALGLYLAWGTYRLQMAAWWISLVSCTILTVSSAITFLKVDFFDVYRELGYPPDQIELLRKYSFFGGAVMVWWIVICYILFLGFLVWIRKYFRSPQPPGETA